MSWEELYAALHIQLMGGGSGAGSTSVARVPAYSAENAGQSLYVSATGELVWSTPAMITISNAVETQTFVTAQKDTADEAALKTALAAQINAVEAVSGAGITVADSDITVLSFVAAVAGDGDDTKGKDGSFQFMVKLTADAVTVSTAKLNGTITATAYEGQSNADAVAAAKAAVEGAEYTVEQASAGSEAALKTALAAKINAVAGMSDTGITVVEGDLAVSGFQAAVKGDADNGAGTNGSFSFTVTLVKGKSNAVTDSKAGTITATPYDGVTNEEAVSTAKSAIEGGTYTFDQAAVTDEATAKEELPDKINALDGMDATGITVVQDDVTVSDFKAAVAGDADNGPGTDGSFHFTVTLSKGKSNTTTDSTAATITATAYAGQTNAAAVAAAKAAIEGGTYTYTQAEVNTQEALPALLVEKVNAASGMDATGITVAAENISVTAFTAAVAGTVEAATGTNGTFTFTVSLTKGKSTDTATGTGTITATAYTA